MEQCGGDGGRRSLKWRGGGGGSGGKEQCGGEGCDA